MLYEVAGDGPGRPTGERFMIIKRKWMELDDGDQGIAVENVDWTGCWLKTKRALIEEYKMGYIIKGYQPEAPKSITMCDDPYVIIVNGKAQANKNNTISYLSAFIIYLTTVGIIFPFFYYFAVNASSRPLEIMFGSAVAAVILSCITIPLWKWGIEIPWRVRKQQRLYDRGELKGQFEQFIKECRK